MATVYMEDGTKHNSNDPQRTECAKCGLPTSVDDYGLCNDCHDSEETVSAETADAMHATITGLMRENERLREALSKMVAYIGQDVPSYDCGKKRMYDAARAALNGGGK